MPPLSEIAPFHNREDIVQSLNDIYQKFGAVAEAVALLETEIGNALLMIRGLEKGLLSEPNPEIAAGILDTINRSTLGRLIRGMGAAAPDLEGLLSDALRERNRLFHTFYREHNFRRNSDEGRAIMWNDLESIHETVHRAYKALMLVRGIDLDALVNAGVSPAPTDHLPI
jgi:hypothetical protein